MIGWDLPYPSQRAPVLARRAVATSQPLAAEAGLEAMRRGGSAVDAALAAAITLTVVEPNNNGVGSDAFAQVWDGRALYGLNASGRAPGAWSIDLFAGQRTMPSLGWDSVTVPGAVSAWVELSSRFGRLPFATLFERAIGYAEDGFLVGPKTALYWELLAPQYARFREFGAHFLPGGRAPRTGERMRRPELAATLRAIAESHGEAFYRGELAERIVAHARDTGGAMTLDDLAEHTADWVTPLAQRYRETTVHEIPPNGQGLAALIALGVLDRLDIGAFGVDSVDATHVQLEAMKVAIRAAMEHFADITAMRVRPEELLDPRRLDSLARGIGASASRVPAAVLPTGPDTVYLAAADADGMMVSMIQSNYQAFGSGIVVPGTGIAMQNRGHGFSLDPSHPNCVAPRKRPYHTIIPGFVTDARGARMAFGVMGGPMQHQGHVQMVSRIFDFHQNPQAASDAPRWHLWPDGSSFGIALESGFPADVARGLADRGHAVATDSREALYGGAQLILRLDDGYCAASDHRKEGCAAGY
jgi:gamma-glutamyltranspeptidase/glutathione hydrolase